MRKLTILVSLCLCLTAAGTALAMSSSSYQLPWQAVSSGGGMRDSPSYLLGDSTGQPATGTAQSSSYRLEAGFWPGVTPGALQVIEDVWTYDLNAGLNLWALTAEPSDNYTASTLAASINAQGGSVIKIFQWFQGYWQCHWVDIPTMNDFAIEPGRGYFILCTAPSTWEMPVEP